METQSISSAVLGASPCEHNGYMRCVAINLQDAGADLGYSDGPMTDEHSVALEVLVNDHDQICRFHSNSVILSYYFF